MSARTWHDDYPTQMRPANEASVTTQAVTQSATSGPTATLRARGGGGTPAPTPAPAPAMLPARTMNRARGEGPTVRCCHRRLVSADQLVRIPARLMLRVCARFPHLPPTGPIYLCDACIETLRRENIIGIAELHFTSEDS